MKTAASTVAMSSQPPHSRRARRGTRIGRDRAATPYGLCADERPERVREVRHDLNPLLHERHLVVEDLRAHGCEVVSIADGFDLAGPAAEIVLAVLAWAAKSERAAINERISAARERVEAEGGKWGRPPSFTEQDRVKVVAMRREGRTIREIAMALKVPRSTVARAAWAR